MMTRNERNDIAHALDRWANYLSGAENRISGKESDKAKQLRRLARRIEAGDIDGLDGSATTPAFVTGSHAYGEPNAKSDLDLVVYVRNPIDLVKLVKAADEDLHEANSGYREEDARSLRFGNLNLLCVDDLKHYEVWSEATKDMKQTKKRTGKPVDREEAIKVLAERRKREGLSL